MADKFAVLLNLKETGLMLEKKKGLFAAFASLRFPEDPHAMWFSLKDQGIHRIQAIGKAILQLSALR